MNPLCSLLLALALILPVGSFVALAEPAPIARDRLGPIWRTEYDLYLRARFEDLKPLRPNLPTPGELLADLSIHHLLAAKAEVQFASWENLPEVRWGLWELECGESENRLIEEILSPSEDPTPGEIEEYFKEHRANFARVGSFSIRRVFFDASQCGDEACRKDLELKAHATLARMLEGEKPGEGEVPLERFLEAAAWATGSPTSAFQVSGPHALGKLARSIEEAAMGLEPGHVGHVIPTKFGFHIVRLETKEVPRLLSLEEAAPSIVETLNYRKVHNSLMELRLRLRASDALKVDEGALAEFVASATLEGVSDHVLLAMAGDLKITFKDFHDLLKVRPLGVLEEEQTDERLLEAYRGHLYQAVLIPELTRQEAARHGLTEDTTYEQRYRMDRIALIGKTLFDRELRKRLSALPTASATDIRTYHEGRLSEFMTKPNYILREIAVQPRDATRPSEMEFAFREAEAEALKALAEIHAGTPEEQVVRKWSTGEEAARGGVTPPLVAGSRYPKAIWDSLLELPMGTWSPLPFRHLGKVILAKVIEIIPPRQRTLGECFDEIFVRLTRNREIKETRRLREEILKDTNLLQYEAEVRKLPPLSERIQ